MDDASQPAAAPHRRRDWDGVAAVIAAFVGLLALSISAYTAWLQQRQVSAQVWPHLIIANSSTDRDILVVNKGVGPALVRSVEIFVDGKAQRSWEDVFKNIGLSIDPKKWGSSTVNGDVLTAGETIAAVKFERDEDFMALAAQSDRIKERICYCLVLGECWLRDTRQKDRLLRDQPIDRCGRDEANEFHDYGE